MFFIFFALLVVLWLVSMTAVLAVVYLTKFVVLAVIVWLLYRTIKPGRRPGGTL